jgi:SAM-dependent MidA family methyltransferase
MMAGGHAHQSSTLPTLPEPGPEALEHSRRLAEHLRREIAAAGGWIPFARYMELALYAPSLGYYSAGAHKFGAAGDFVTAPELTPLFGRTLARQAAQVLAEAGGDILELGPGSGRLALDLLTELERLGRLPGRYLMLERSADLRQRQEALFAARAPELLPRLAWLDQLPKRHTGLILGNEVLDALPVHLLHWSSPQPSPQGGGGGRGTLERGVVADGEGFAWADRPVSDPALLDVANVLPVRGTDYLSEAAPAVAALVRALAGILERGAVLFLDYGFPRAEYYHPQRDRGTLMCHYRHRAHDDPFFLPGLNDITAHVDFSAVAEAAVAGGLAVLGYADQARFLINCGLLDLLTESEPGTADYYRAAAAVQKLLSPTEMGELFKVIALGKGMDGPLLGFAAGDRRGRL